MDEILKRLLPLFRDVLNDRTLIVTPASNAETIPGYDSLAHINVITAIEQEFRVSFEFSELVHLDCVGDMIALLIKKTRAVA
jgi:acyl carrier protein